MDKHSCLSRRELEPPLRVEARHALMGLCGCTTAGCVSDAAHATLGVAGSKKGCRKGLQEKVTGTNEGGCTSRVTGRGYRKEVAGAGLREGVAGRGVTGSKKGCRKGLRERRHSRNPLTQPLFGGVSSSQWFPTHRVSFQGLDDRT